MALQWFTPVKRQNPLGKTEMNSLERIASRFFFSLGMMARITKTNTFILIKETVEDPQEKWSTNQLRIVTMQHGD